MDLKTIERYVLDEWVFIPICLVVAVNSFGLGLAIGWIWVSL